MSGSEINRLEVDMAMLQSMATEAHVEGEHK